MFSFGFTDESLLAHAWVSENTDSRPRRVGLSRPNPYGLFDMLGNIDEWVRGEETARGGGEKSHSLKAGGRFSTPKSVFEEGVPLVLVDNPLEESAGIRIVRTVEPGIRSLDE